MAQGRLCISLSLSLPLRTAYDEICSGSDISRETSTTKTIRSGTFAMVVLPLSFSALRLTVPCPGRAACSLALLSPPSAGGVLSSARRE